MKQKATSEKAHSLKRDKKIILGLRTEPPEFEQELTTFMRDNRAKIIGMLRKWGCSEEDAKDIFQESIWVLVRMIKKPDFSADTIKINLEAYLVGIVKKLCSKKFSKRRLILDNIPEEVKEDSAINDFIQRDYTDARIKLFRKLLEHLSNRCRDYFLNAYRNHSLEVIAENLKINYSSVKTLKGRCQKQLDDLLLNPKIQKLLKDI